VTAVSLHFEFSNANRNGLWSLGPEGLSGGYRAGKVAEVHGNRTLFVVYNILIYILIFLQFLNPAKPKKSPEVSINRRNPLLPGNADYVQCLPEKIILANHARAQARSNRRSSQRRHAMNLFFQTDLLPKEHREPVRRRRPRRHQTLRLLGQLHQQDERLLRFLQV
jgi:hypothetical protein